MGFNYMSRGNAYWSWCKAAQYADTTSENVRTTITTDKKESLTYYTHEGFGSVAATVNVGRPVTDYSRINGVQARFQAYSVAQVVLFDTPEFPHADGKNYPLSSRLNYANVIKTSIRK